MEENLVSQGIDSQVLRKDSETIAKAVVSEITTGASVKRIPYHPLADCPPAKTLMPTNLASETLIALANLKDKVGDVTQYVINKLQYPSKLSLCRAFKGEQVDAIALAIYQIEQNKGFLIGDMAGIGKGRVVAGVMRYAYLNGKIPIFVTVSPNLFSDIFRDIIGIEGFRHNPDGSIFIPKPLILNGYDSKGSTSVFFEGADLPAYVGQKTDVLNNIFSNVVNDNKPFDLNEFQIVLSTYSQFNSKKAMLKSQFIESISPDSVFCLDESHNASGANSNTGSFFRQNVAVSNGAFFASATSAKVPKEILLYALKTDIIEAASNTDTLLSTITSGGEPLMEYLSATMVKSGQMIRRERSFEDCPIDYKVMSEGREKVWEMYDNVVLKYNKINKFVKQENYKNAIRRSVEDIAKEANIEITHQKPSDFKNIKEATAWRRRNAGSYYYTVTLGGIGSTRFNFIENLLFALKAEFVGNVAVDNLTEFVDYLYLEGDIVNTNKKPILAVRNTMETIFEKMGYKIGDIIEKPDFALIVEGLLKESIKFSVKFKLVAPRATTTPAVPSAEGEGTSEETSSSETPTETPQPTETEPEQLPSLAFAKNWINLDYFPDKGKEYNDLLEEFSQFTSNIFISPIDKLMEKIEEGQRDSRDSWGNGRLNFAVSEITGRKYMVRKNADGKYVLLKNTRHEDIKDAFRGYNNGEYDALIINERGSTGASLQSHFRYKDRRPRAMVIHQVELDVNVEVQKRGRVNRTGQINLPTYVYVTSPIPAEIRRLLMLKRKLRTLDAIVTGNQLQSDELTLFKDGSGNLIEDFYNVYGADVLRDFLSQTENDYFVQFYTDNWASEAFAIDESGFIDAFARELELAPAERQNEFYDKMNVAYIKKKAELVESGEFLLETTLDDLKASVKARAEIKLGVNTSYFNTGVFEEENFVMASTKIKTPQEIKETIDKLCNGQDPYKFHEQLVTEYQTEYDVYLGNLIKEKYPKPDPTGKSEDEYSFMLQVWEEEIALETRHRLNEKARVLKILQFFVPSKAIAMPLSIQPLLDDPDMDIKKLPYKYGKFLGYSIQARGGGLKFKYQASAFDMVFAFIDEKASDRITPTPQSTKVMLFDITMEATNNPSIFDRMAQKLVAEWKVDTQKRVRMRNFTGNIIDAMAIAEFRKQRDMIKMYKYVKYTTVDGEIQNGVRLWYDKPVGGEIPEFLPSEVQVSIPTINMEFAKKIFEMVDKNVATAPQKSGEAIICKEVNNTLHRYFKIYEGRVESKDGEWQLIKKPTHNITSVFYDDERFASFFSIPPQIEIETPPHTKNIYYRVKSFVIQHDTDLIGLGKYMYEVRKQSFIFHQMGASGEETVQGRVDEYVPSTTKPHEQKEEVKGDFTYELTEPYDSGFKIKGFVDIDKDLAEYGVVRTSVMLTPLECVGYRLIPTNHTPTQKVTNFFNAFGTSERRMLVREIKKMKDDSLQKIGIFINRELTKAGIFDYRYVFGRVSFVNVADLVVKFVTSEEFSEASLLPEEKEDASVVAERAIKPKSLNMENVIDYLTLLNID